MLYIIEDMINGVLMGSIYGLTAMSLMGIKTVRKITDHGITVLMVE